jgi:uncharacterized protein YhfF
MDMNMAIEAFWSAYCATQENPATCVLTPYDAWSFGDSQSLADELAQLVLTGAKTTTAGLVWEHEYFGWQMPAVGNKIVILDGEQLPRCVIETTAVTIQPFVDVDTAFAQREGEGWDTIEQWRASHWRYFSRRCAEMGKEPSAQMPVVCHQFRVVYPSSSADMNAQK